MWALPLIIVFIPCYPNLFIYRLMLALARPILAWMARRWPVDAGEAEVLGELDRFLATGQLPTDQRRLDVSAADYARGILQRVAIEEERAQERRADRAAREREAMIRRVQADAAEQVRAAELRTEQRRLEFAASQVGEISNFP